MRVLILNSDSPNNRGDRPILAGNIRLIREKFPEAEIWSQSEHTDRDEEWYGIKFLPISAYTTNPLHFLRLLKFARSCDYIFWGGGEILKDYTNKLGVLYWALKISMIRMVNKNLYGAFQGIGPTESAVSKKLIAFTINLTRAFIVRDHESAQKLKNWGVKVPLIESFDPAILLDPEPITNDTLEILKEEYDLDDTFFDNMVGIGLRKWFHYKKSSWIPFKFKKQAPTNPTLEAYLHNVAQICDGIIERRNVTLAFFPMHMGSSENDAAFARQVIRHMKYKDKTCVIDKDTLSPQSYLSVIGLCKAFVGSRLHSTILSTSANIPSWTFYYVDKGRLYFEQIDMKHYSLPIESLLKQAEIETIQTRIDSLFTDKAKIKQELSKNIATMRAKIRSDFSQALRGEK